MKGALADFAETLEERLASLQTRVYDLEDDVRTLRSVNREQQSRKRERSPAPRRNGGAWIRIEHIPTDLGRNWLFDTMKSYGYITKIYRHEEKGEEGEIISAADWAEIRFRDEESVRRILERKQVLEDNYGIICMPSYHQKRTR